MLVNLSGSYILGQLQQFSRCLIRKEYLCICYKKALMLSLANYNLMVF